MTTPNDSDREMTQVADAPPLPPTPPLPQPPDGEGDTPQRAVGLNRFPALAAFLALVPGLGHLYVGAYTRAAMIVIGIIAIVVIIPLPVNVFLALFTWFFGIFDAYRQAQLVNLGAQELAPTSPGSGQSTLAFGVFLTVVGALLLVNNFFPLEMDWLRDWWPAIPVLAGVYLIGSALYERSRRADRDPGDLDD